MPVEKSSGFIVFRKKEKNILYLLLHYPEGHWDFPKGHIEEEENPLETAKRELKEETGLEKIKVVDGFKKTIKYFFRKEGKTVLKFVTFFLAEALEDKVKLSFEHQEFKWLPFDKALKLTTYKNAKEVLKSAHQFLLKANFSK